jgi:hypothetical protein
MDEVELANRFDRQRPRLHAVAYRIVGSLEMAAVTSSNLRHRARGVDEAIAFAFGAPNRAACMTVREGQAPAIQRGYRSGPSWCDT